MNLETSVLDSPTRLDHIGWLTESITKRPRVKKDFKHGLLVINELPLDNIKQPNILFIFQPDKNLNNFQSDQ